MSTEAIARAAAQMKRGQFSSPATSARAGQPLGSLSLEAMHQTALADATIVDVQALRDSVDTDPDPGLRIYEDSVLRPPWVNALLGYQTPNGVTCLTNIQYQERLDDSGPFDTWQPDNMTGPHGEPVDDVPHRIDWDKVRWVAAVTYWLSGKVPTSGPHHVEHLAIDANGKLLDLRWTQLRPDIPLNQWETAQWVWLKAITFLNCTNVTLVTPTRTRAERRRLDRITDQDITEIQVFKTGRSVRGAKHPPGDGVPFTTVRGHIARYGPQPGNEPDRGLLFGKYAGEFWIPQSARGRTELGSTDHRYTIRNETL